MRFLVVCGFLETPAIFCPIQAFSKVDFPALGRPIRATKPERVLAIDGVAIGGVVDADNGVGVDVVVEVVIKFSESHVHLAGPGPCSKSQALLERKE